MSSRILASLDHIATWAHEKLSHSVPGARSMLAVAKRLGLYDREQREAAHHEFSFLWSAFNPSPIEAGNVVRRQVTSSPSAGQPSGRISAKSGSGRN